MKAKGVIEVTPLGGGPPGGGAPLATSADIRTTNICAVACAAVLCKSHAPARTAACARAGRLGSRRARPRPCMAGGRLGPGMEGGPTAKDVAGHGLAAL